MKRRPRADCHSAARTLAVARPPIQSVAARTQASFGIGGLLTYARHRRHKVGEGTWDRSHDDVARERSTLGRLLSAVTSILDSGRGVRDARNVCTECEGNLTDQRRVDGRVVTIDEAVVLTGLSRRAIEGRIARRTLDAEKRGGRLFVKIRDLRRQQLLRSDAGGREEYVISELLDRLEAQARQIGRLCAALERRKSA